MEFIQIKTDYDWVLKVLKSCETKEQLQVAQKLFDNFIYKWLSDLSEEKTLTFNWNFQKHKSQKIIELRSFIP